MHITNLQLVLALFAISVAAAYLLGRRHGRRALRQEFIEGPVGKLALGTAKIRRLS